jgi:hypothetical protein
MIYFVGIKHLAKVPVRSAPGIGDLIVYILNGTGSTAARPAKNNFSWNMRGEWQIFILGG